MTMTLTMNRMDSTLSERSGRDRRGTVESVTAPEQRGRAFASAPRSPPFRRIDRVDPRPPTASSCRATRTRTTPLPGVAEAVVATVPEINRYPDATALALRERSPRRFGVTGRRGARRRRLGVAARPVHRRGGGPGRRGRLLVALVRGLPGPRHRRRRDERAGAEPARPRARPRRRWRRRSPTAPASSSSAPPTTPRAPSSPPTSSSAFMARGARRPARAARRGVHRVRPRRGIRRRPHAHRPLPEPRRAAHLLEGLRARRAARRLRDRAGRDPRRRPRRRRSRSASPRPRRRRARIARSTPRPNCSTGSTSSSQRRDRPCARRSSSRAGRCPRRRATSSGCPPATTRRPSPTACSTPGS